MATEVIMKITKSQLRKIIKEAISLDIDVGDVVLTGKFKNKRQVVKDIGTDDSGQPTINGRTILKLKIEKLMPKSKWSAKSREELEESLRRTIREEIGRNFQSIDTDSYTYEDYSDVQIETYPITTSDEWGAAVTCISDPSLSTPERRFADEQSAEHWTRMEAEKIFRKTLNKEK